MTATPEPPSTEGPRGSPPPRRSDEGSHLGGWFSRLGQRLARSSRVFLLGLLVACGIEVAVDWNSTLFEINVLREAMRQRGKNYAGILTHAALAPVLSRDLRALEVLSDGLFDDEDVIYVRFSDAAGRLLYDRLRKDASDLHARRHSRAFRDHYAYQMGRDTNGIIRDPQGLARRIAKSRYRDLFQRYNDLVDRLVAVFVSPKAKDPASNSQILFQDRLRDGSGRHDVNVTYAIGAVLDPPGVPRGVALVAFSMDRTNAAVFKKLLKGAGIVLFFVSLILVQNILSRRDKLRLLDLEARYSAAKLALRSALLEVEATPPLSAGVALSQATGSVDGMVFGSRVLPTGLELFVVDPDGDGIDAASVALQVLSTYRGRRDQEGEPPSLLEEVAALGVAARSIPLTRPISLLLLRIDAASGRIAGITSPMGGICLLGAEGPRPVDESPVEETPSGVVGPLVSIAGRLEEDETLVGLSHGGGRLASPKDPAGSVAGFVSRRSDRDVRHPTDLAADAVKWARGHLTGLAAEDLVVLLARRTPLS